MDVSLRRREFLTLIAALGTTAFAAQSPPPLGAPSWARRHKEVARRTRQCIEDSP
jgi:hypothetical protein